LFKLIILNSHFDDDDDASVQVKKRDDDSLDPRIFVLRRPSSPTGRRSTCVVAF
jgi:hypothetical protein